MDFGRLKNRAEEIIRTEETLTKSAGLHREFVFYIVSECVQKLALDY
jgi:hypothetical protein